MDIRLSVIKNLQTMRGCLAAIRSEHLLQSDDGVTAALERAKMVCDGEQRGAIEAASLLHAGGNTDAALEVIELLQLNAQQAEQIVSMRRVAGQMAREIDQLRGVTQ